MKRMIFLSLLAFTSIAIQAQPPQKTRVIKTEHVIGPTFTRDKKTTTIKWNSTENNSWHEDIGILEKVPTTDIQSVFPNSYKLIIENPDFQATGWRLTDEGDNTVLHCYLHMPADIVTNLWLGNAESVILDTETGIIYQAQSTVPEHCYNKVFGVKGKKDTALDLQIIFPRLPETAQKLAIYGVPNWNLRGSKLEHRYYVSREEAYDDIPQFHTARMVKESVDYNKDNLDSWAVYTDPHLIKPVKEGTMAIWRTPDATYLARATEQNWLREYYGRNSNTILLDQQGRPYKCKEVMGYPNDNIFWLEGYPGDHFAIVEVFEPLPLDVATFSYIEPEGEPFNAWGADWSGEVIPDLDVQLLRDNQHLFEYHPRVVVK